MINDDDEIPKEIKKICEVYKKDMIALHFNLNIDYIDIVKFIWKKELTERSLSNVALNIRKSMERIVNSSFLANENNYSKKIKDMRKTYDKNTKKEFMDNLKLENPNFLPKKMLVLEKSNKWNYFFEDKNSESELLDIWKKTSSYLHVSLKKERDYNDDYVILESLKDILKMHSFLIDLLTVHTLKIYNQPYIFYINISPTKVVCRVLTEKQIKKLTEFPQNNIEIFKTELNEKKLEVEKWRQTISERNDSLINLYLNKKFYPNEKWQRLIDKLKSSNQIK